MVRYFVAPGWVTSINDGDRHWVTAPQLVRLYGLRRGEWRLWDRKEEEVARSRGSAVTVLWPRRDGRYDKVAQVIDDARRTPL